MWCRSQCKKRGRRLTCWSWPGSASPWRWAWACGRCVQRGTPAWGWRGTGTWWPGTWSEGTGRSWWGCRRGPPCPARHTWLSTRRKLPSAPAGRCWKSERGEFIANGREEQRDINQAALSKSAGSGDCNRWNATRLPWIRMMFAKAVFRSLLMVLPVTWLGKHLNAALSCLISNQWNVKSQWFVHWFN